MLNQLTVVYRGNTGFLLLVNQSPHTATDLISAGKRYYHNDIQGNGQSGITILRKTQ